MKVIIYIQINHCTCMTSPIILVVRITNDTEGPNRLPGKSSLTLFRSKTGMASVVVAWRGDLRDNDATSVGLVSLLVSRRLDVVPFCVCHTLTTYSLLGPASPHYSQLDLLYFFTLSQTAFCTELYKSVNCLLITFVIFRRWITCKIDIFIDITIFLNSCITK